MLTKQDHQRIADAIAKAESKTSGEIFCVLAQEVSRYREIPLLWGAVAALALPPLLVAGLDLLLPSGSFTGWSDGSIHAAEGLILRALSAYSLVQAGLFLTVALIVSLPKVRRALTPSFLKSHRVRQVARHHFAASGSRLTHVQPHVMIFASLEDRKVELVAHENIHRAVGDGPWNASVAAVIEGMKASRPADGFIRAIEICGEALAQNFPSQGPARNALPNDILEL